MYNVHAVCHIGGYAIPNRDPHSSWLPLRQAINQSLLASYIRFIHWEHFSFLLLPPFFAVYCLCKSGRTKIIISCTNFFFPFLQGIPTSTSYFPRCLEQPGRATTTCLFHRCLEHNGWAIQQGSSLDVWKIRAGLIQHASSLDIWNIQLGLLLHASSPYVWYISLGYHNILVP